MKLFFTLIFVIGSVQYVDNDGSRRIISDDNFNYVFYISDKNSNNYKNYKDYYWFKTGKVNSSKGGSNGKLLHGIYKKSYKDRVLAEQGEFHYGLKDKEWVSWYNNGEIKEIHNWNKGIATGKYQKYLESGELLITGTYRSNRKHGRWINHQVKDTLYFKKGETVVEQPEEEKIEKTEDVEKKNFLSKVKDFFKSFKNIFKKKTPEEKEELKKQKEIKKKQKELDKKRKELTKKKKSKKDKDQTKQN